MFAPNCFSLVVFIQKYFCLDSMLPFYLVIPCSRIDLSSPSYRGRTSLQLVPRLYSSITGRPTCIHLHLFLMLSPLCKLPVSGWGRLQKSQCHSVNCMNGNNSSHCDRPSWRHSVCGTEVQSRIIRAQVRSSNVTFTQIVVLWSGRTCWIIKLTVESLCCCRRFVIRDFTSTTRDLIDGPHLNLVPASPNCWVCAYHNVRSLSYYVKSL